MNAEVITHFYEKPEFWVNALLALFTGLLFGATYLMVKRGKADSERQSREMKDSISAAVRSAEAMEKVAANSYKGSEAAIESVNALKERTARQMRAYLVVNVNSGLFQDRQNNIPFGVTPILINTGQTPAHNVRYTARCGILSLPLPDDYDFPLPDPHNEGAILGPHQDMTLHSRFDTMVPDDLASDVKYGRGNSRLYVWGEVRYEDVFGETHYTKFCHFIFWITDPGKPDNVSIHGFYAERHNEAT